MTGFFLLIVVNDHLRRRRHRLAAADARQKVAPGDCGANQPQYRQSRLLQRVKEGRGGPPPPVELRRS
jgi:hypothetical protein